MSINIARDINFFTLTNALITQINNMLEKAIAIDIQQKPETIKNVIEMKYFVNIIDELHNSLVLIHTLMGNNDKKSTDVDTICSRVSDVITIDTKSKKDLRASNLGLWINPHANEHRRQLCAKELVTDTLFLNIRTLNEIKKNITTLDHTYESNSSICKLTDRLSTIQHAKIEQFWQDNPQFLRFPVAKRQRQDNHTKTYSSTLSMHAIDVIDNQFPSDASEEDPHTATDNEEEYQRDANIRTRITDDEHGVTSNSPEEESHRGTEDIEENQTDANSIGPFHICNPQLNAIDDWDRTSLAQENDLSLSEIVNDENTEIPNTHTEINNHTEETIYTSTFLFKSPSQTHTTFTEENTCNRNINEDTQETQSQISSRRRNIDWDSQSRISSSWCNMNWDSQWRISSSWRNMDWDSQSRRSLIRQPQSTTSSCSRRLTRVILETLPDGI